MLIMYHKVVWLDVMVVTSTIIMGMKGTELVEVCVMLAGMRRILVECVPVTVRLTSMRIIPRGDALHDVMDN